MFQRVIVELSDTSLIANIQNICRLQMRQAHELNYFSRTGLIETEEYKKQDITIFLKIPNPVYL